MEHVDAHPNDIGAFVRNHFGISRQAVNLHLRRLQRDGGLAAEGNTRAREYRRTAKHAELAIEGLIEHDVFSEHVHPHLDGLPTHVSRICEYGVTEIVNNAIDHSGSDTLRIATHRTADAVVITIEDRGLGIFRKIQAACGLHDAGLARFELTKGKLTTDPTRHTGEGIFFTSRMFDRFTLRSYELCLSHRRETNEWLLRDPDPDDRPVNGTMVSLTISPISTHTTTEVFEKYSVEPGGCAFNKTHVPVALAMSDALSLVSRSQAKRIVARLETFKEVVLDFTDVHEIGPAFADEIFRVFAERHPQTDLVPVKMAEQVTRMVRRAQTHDQPLTESA